MKNLFITGISGLLGANLAFLLKDEFNISGVDLRPFRMEKISAQVGDILDKHYVNELLVRYKPDVIVHCAAAVNVDGCEADPKMATSINTTATQIMSELAAAVGAKFIYISTDAVFDGTKCGLYNEVDDINPINIYAKTKADGESFVLENEHSLVLRTNIYGFNYSQQQSFGEWVLNALVKNETLTMFTDVLFSPILVNDLADVIRVALDKGVCGLYHACAKGSISKYDFGCCLKAVFGITSGSITPISVDEFEFKAKRAKNMGMDSSKFFSDTGYVFKTPSESIEEFYRLWKNRYPNKLKSSCCLDS